MQATDGNLYGVSQTAGNFSGSILYSFDPPTSGVFYGTSEEQGTHGDGFLFSVDMSLGPFVAFVYPGGKVGSTVEILGQGLTGSTAVTFNGLAATSFTVVSDTYMTAQLPVRSW